jgi:hypothetical protein
VLEFDRLGNRDGYFISLNYSKNGPMYLGYDKLGNPFMSYKLKKNK